MLKAAGLYLVWRQLGLLCNDGAVKVANDVASLLHLPHLPTNRDAAAAAA